MISHQSRKGVLEAALEYVGRGWSVIPLKPDTKKAAIRWTAFQSRRATVEDVTGWFDRTDFAVGIVLGPVSGNLACRDFDAPESYRAWSAAFPDFARRIPTARTRRGFHAYFRHSEGASEADRESERRGTRKKGIIAMGDGELRLRGCYCVAPPSQVGETVYGWLTPPGSDIPAVCPSAAGLDRSWGNGVVAPSTGNWRNPPNTPRDVSAGSWVPCGLCVAPAEIKALVERCLPGQEGERHRKLFDLARALRSLPNAWDSNPTAFEEVFDRWFASALPHIRTRDRIENWGEFLQSWAAVKHRIGDEPISQALEAATKQPYPNCAAKYAENPKVQQLIALCAELQRIAGPSPFYLGTRAAGELFGVNFSTVSRWLTALRHDGILRLVSQGSRDARRVSEFLFLEQPA